MTRSAEKGSSGVSILQLARIKPLPTGVFWGSFKAFISSTVKIVTRNSFTMISSINTKCRRRTIINNDLQLYLLCRNMNARMHCSQHILTASKCQSRNKCRHQCLQSSENDIRFSLSISTSALLATIWFAVRIHSRCSALLRVSNTWNNDYVHIVINDIVNWLKFIKTCIWCIQILLSPLFVDGCVGTDSELHECCAWKYSMSCVQIVERCVALNVRCEDWGVRCDSGMRCEVFGILVVWDVRCEGCEGHWVRCSHIRKRTWLE